MEAERLNRVYAEQTAIIEANTQAGSAAQTELLARAAAQRDAGLAAIEQRNADEQARQAAERLRQEQASGIPALERLIAANQSLAAETDVGAGALERRTEATRIATLIETEFAAATNETKAALREQYQVQAELLRQQQLRAEMLSAYGGGQPRPERQAALDALMAQGQLGGLAAQAAQADINIDAGQGSMADGYISELGRMVAETDLAAASMGAAFARVYGPGGSFSAGIADAAARAIVFGDSFRDAVGQAAQQAVGALLSQLIQLGIQMLITRAIGATVGKTAAAAQLAQTTLQVAATTALAAQNAYMATAAIPVVGPGLAPAAAGIAAGAAGALGATAVAATAAKIAAFAKGGVVEQETHFSARGIAHGVMGEAGPEAILPVQRAWDGYRVRALTAGGEQGLALARMTDGVLGVDLRRDAQPFARGGVINAPPLPLTTFARGRIIDQAPPHRPAAPATAPARQVTIHIAPTIQITAVDAAGNAADPEALGEGLSRRVVAEMTALVKGTLIDEQRVGGALNPTDEV